MQRRNVLSSPRLSELKKRRRRAILNKLFLIFLGFLAIFILLSYISKNQNLNINDIQIVGNKVLETETLKQLAANDLNGKYLWLFPKTNVLLYPRNTIKNDLQKKFKRLKEVNLSIKNRRTLEITVLERTALYMWCNAPTPDLNIENTQKCYFLDTNGYVFDEAPYFSGEVYFKFYGSAGLDPANPLGSYFSKQNFQQLISFKNTLSDIGLKPTIFNIADNGDLEIFLSKDTISINNPKIILKINADFKNIIENLETALNTEPLKSKFKNKYSSLEYIDLRFGNKVYAKFQ